MFDTTAKLGVMSLLSIARCYVKPLVSERTTISLLAQRNRSRNVIKLHTSLSKTPGYMSDVAEKENYDSHTKLLLLV